eukprot:2674859-Rhodomonas_salina.1
MPRICGVVVAEEPGTASWSVVSGSNDLDRQEGSRPWDDGRRQWLELLGLAATGLTGTQMAGDADPHYIQTLDAHTSERARRTTEDRTEGLGGGLDLWTTVTGTSDHVIMSYRGWRRFRQRAHFHGRTRQITLFSQRMLDAVGWMDQTCLGTG